MNIIKSHPFLWFLVTVGLIGGIALLGPEVKELGSNVRLVYLHGAWVLAAEIAFVGAGIIGLLALLLRHPVLHRWSGALGRTGIVFWITYLPLSMWAMQANWNGLFLSEPRFRLALIFAVVGLLLQLGLWIMDLASLTSLVNILFIVLLRYTFSQASNIMHPPPSPIFSSGLWQVIAFYLGLNILVLLAAYFLTLYWLKIGSNKAKL
ncbi:MAG: hypothetical protein MUC85_00260 [Anaerolineales bacterium]|jgi:hypothetical protein|nr:hypothetical protein [Anaerolineales bacterium]